MLKAQKERDMSSYKRLDLVDSKDDLLSTPNEAKTYHRLSSYYALWMIVCTQAVALAFLILTRRVASPAYKPNLLYCVCPSELDVLLVLTLSSAPAQNAVEYQLKRFHSDPVFTAPPSKTLDKAWTDLYQCEHPSPVVIQKALTTLYISWHRQDYT